VKAFALTSADKPAGLIDLAVPDLAENGIRIRVRAAGVNGFDLFQAGGHLVPMMEHIFPATVGRDFAGVVDAVGSDWSDVQVGDEVFGFVSAMPPLHDGSFVEVFTATSGLELAPKPDGLSFATAASIPLAGATALAAVEAIDAGPGDVVLIVGATGGVGSIAVQLATQRGATVIATAKPGPDEDFVRSLGASETVDYSNGEVAATIHARHPDGVSALIDTVDRGEEFSRMATLVRDGGRVATTLSTADVEALAARGVRATNVRGMPTSENLSWLADQVAEGKLRIEIQGTYPLADVETAFAAFIAGTRGKLVLSVG